MKVKVFNPDGTWYEKEVRAIIVPEEEHEPTTEEIMDAMLGVTE